MAATKANPMPHMKPAAARRQRYKKAVSAQSPSLVSAAVSISSDLYVRALRVAESDFEGNFSRYVRHLIKKDNRAA